MQTFLAVILAMIFGIALGVGVAVARIAVAPWDGDPEGVRGSSHTVSPTSGPVPKVVVDREEYDFGMMDIFAEGRHDFIFTNRGDAALVLTEAETSCRCTLSEIEDGTIMPGRSGKVTVK